MKIKDVKIKPIDDKELQHVKPALQIEVELEYIVSQEMLLNIYGDIIVDKKIIAPIKISEIPDSELNPKIEDGEKFAPTNITIKEYVELDRELVDYIERSRDSNPERNVTFNFKLTASYLENAVVLSYVAELSTSILNQGTSKIIDNIIGRGYTLNERDISLLVYAHPSQSPYHQDRPNLNLMSTSGTGYMYIAHKSITRRCETTIPSSEWIYNYAPKLGIGNFLVLEIPLKFPDNNNKLNDDTLKALKNVWILISTAEKSFLDMNPQGVISTCRQAVESLSKFMADRYKDKHQLTDWQKDTMEKIIRLSGKRLGDLKSLNKEYNNKQPKENPKGMEDKDKQEKDADNKDNSSNKSGWLGIFGFLSFMSHDQTQNDGTVHSLILPDSYDAEAALFFTKVFVKFVAEILYKDNEK